MDSDLKPESKLISLITQLVSNTNHTDFTLELMSLITQIISLVCSMDLDSEPKLEPELMSLVTQAVSIFNSMDMVSQPKPFSKLITLITQLVNSIDSDLASKLESEFVTFSHETLHLDPEPELMSLIHQIFSLVISMNSEWNKLIALTPLVQVTLTQGYGRFRVIQEVEWTRNNKWGCLFGGWELFSLTGEDATHFRCRSCNGMNHEEYENAPVVIKHLLHPRHPLYLVWFDEAGITRKCYCCDEYLERIFYLCLACDYAMNIVCVEKQRVLSIDHSKWHEHTLALFPRMIVMTCDLCSFADSSCPFYLCPPCDFVVHQRCLSLPSVIKMSRHPHRISFTTVFDLGDWSCGVCRKKIDHNYGGYSCIKDGCSYAAHSRCATQSNVWDGIELEGVPEEIEEEIEAFVRISDGIIQHFSHEHHHLRLVENTGRDYDDNKQCQGCVTPIYFSNFYSCMQCDFILHEECANLSRKIHHAIHPHRLTLVGGYDGVMDYTKDQCSACTSMCKTGFFYECGKEECDFKLNVQCSTISEPLIHPSHAHPLFLTSKPGERRMCHFCPTTYLLPRETFNCIECDFSLCFECATLPQKVRYKHDKHSLTLTYGKETSTIPSWCEICEGKVPMNETFYVCGEYCCVTLHTKCLIGNDLYMKPGSSWFHFGKKLSVLPNYLHMSRHVCSSCGKRCPYKIVIQWSGLIFCSTFCIKLN